MIYISMSFSASQQPSISPNGPPLSNDETRALLKRQGLPSNYDRLVARYDAGDKTMINEAEAYQVNIFARDKCSSFGFVSGTPEFNKCVYDFKVQYAQLLMQQ